MLNSLQKRRYTTAVNTHNKSTNASAKSPATTGQPAKTPDRTSQSGATQGRHSQAPTPPHPTDQFTSLEPRDEPDIRRPSGTPAGPSPPALFQPLLSEADIRAMNAMDEDGRERYLEELRVDAKDRLAEKAEWRAWSTAAALKAVNLRALEEKNAQNRALQEKLRAEVDRRAANAAATTSESQDFRLAANVEPINSQDGDVPDNAEQQNSQDNHIPGFEEEVDQTPTDNAEKINAGTFLLHFPCI